MPSNLKANCMGSPLGAANNFSLFSCLHLCAISLCPAKATRHHKGDNVECVRKLCCCCSNNNISFFSHLRPFKYQMSSSLLSCEVHVNLFVTIMSLSGEAANSSQSTSSELSLIASSTHFIIDAHALAHKTEGSKCCIRDRKAGISCIDAHAVPQEWLK